MGCSFVLRSRQKVSYMKTCNGLKTSQNSFLQNRLVSINFLAHCVQKIKINNTDSRPKCIDRRSFLFVISLIIAKLKIFILFFTSKQAHYYTICLYHERCTSFPFCPFKFSSLSHRRYTENRVAK